jgi:hypothetical protein
MRSKSSCRKPGGLADAENALWMALIDVACGTSAEMALDAIFKQWSPNIKNEIAESRDWFGLLPPCMFRLAT